MNGTDTSSQQTELVESLMAELRAVRAEYRAFRSDACEKLRQLRALSDNYAAQLITRPVVERFGQRDLDARRKVKEQRKQLRSLQRKLGDLRKGYAAALSGYRAAQ